MSIRSSDDDPLRVEFRLTESDFLRFRRYLYFRQLRFAKPVTRILLAIFVLLVLLGALSSIGHGWLKMLETSGVSIGFYAAIIIWGFQQSKSFIRADLKKSDTAYIGIFPDGLTKGTNSESVDLRWSAITAIDQNASLVVLLTSNINGIFIPKTAFPSKERCAAFIQAARDMRESSVGKIQKPTKLPDDVLASVVFVPTVDDVAHVYRIAHFRTGKGQRARLILFIFLPAIAFLIVAGGGIDQIVREQDFTILYVALAVALFVAVLLPILTHPKIAAIQLHKRRGMNQKHSVIVFETGFDYVTVLSNIQTTWSKVTDIVCEPDGRTVFIVSGLIAYGVPPSAFVSLENAQRFQRLVTRLWTGQKSPTPINEPQSTESVWPPSPSQIVE